MLVRVAAIEYLNTIPFVYGLTHSSVKEQIELVPCTPSSAADKLLQGDIDLGIVPIATLPLSDRLKIVSDFCISAEGAVASVLLCSPVPLTEIEEVLLDKDSRTSGLLLQLLAENYWHISPKYSSFDFEKEGIDPSRPTLLIGDKALSHSSEFEFCYDLAFEWISFTGKPFVFACWMTNKELDTAFLKNFNEALGYGVLHIKESVKSLCYNFSSDLAIDYLSNNISYKLTPEKKESVSLFLEMAFDPSKFRVRW